MRWIWRGTEKESEEMHSKFWPEDLKRRYILGDKDPENIKMGFKIQDMRMLSGVVSQDVSQWLGCYKHGNEILNCVKGREMF